MRIAICDDDKKCVEKLKIHIEEYFKEHFMNVEIFTTTSPNKIIDSNIAFDLAFLDIQMPEIDGISVAKKLKEKNNKIILFFVTAFDEYQDEAMDLHIFRFFDKPFDVQRLYSSLDKAMEYIDESYIDIYLDKGNQHIKVLVDDIKYIERENRKTSVFTTNSEYTTKSSFDELISKLPNTYFYLIHKSFFINLHYVTKYSYKEIYIDNQRFSVATRKQADFHKYWFNYVKRR